MTAAERIARTEALRAAADAISASEARCNPEGFCDSYAAGVSLGMQRARMAVLNMLLAEQSADIVATCGEITRRAA